MMETGNGLLDLVSRGHSAATVLSAVDAFCALLVDETLTKLDREVGKLSLRPEQALAVCHEIAAYRRITHRLRQQVHAGEKAEIRQRAEQTRQQAQEQDL